MQLQTTEGRSPPGRRVADHKTAEPCRQPSPLTISSNFLFRSLASRLSFAEHAVTLDITVVSVFNPFTAVTSEAGFEAHWMSDTSAFHRKAPLGDLSCEASTRDLGWNP